MKYRINLRFVLVLTIFLVAAVSVQNSPIRAEDSCDFDFNSDGKVNGLDFGYVLKDASSTAGDILNAIRLWGNSCVRLKKAAVLDIPLPKNAKCFWQNEYRDLPECSDFYKEECWGNGSQCELVFACPKFYNPVYDAEGTFYPSACWAEQLGVSIHTYGYSERMLQFIRDLWFLAKDLGPSVGTKYQIPHPNIEFSYVGSGLAGWKNGTFLRSTLWKDEVNFLTLDFDVSTSQNRELFPSLKQSETIFPVIESNPNLLLVFVMFDNAYPEEILIEWTNRYKIYLNDYLKKKQEVANPIQYTLLPVVIDPPEGVEKPSTTHRFFTTEEMQNMYDAAVAKIGQSDFQVFTASPVVLGGFGGYYLFWNDMEFIDAPLSPHAPYSPQDKEQGINSLAAFQGMFGTLSHEILHAAGLSGDHVPMGYGTYFLDAVGQNVDPITGKEKQAPNVCDFYGASPDYYSPELPDNLKIAVGEEPLGLIKRESPSGPCLSGFFNNIFLKDIDKDGEYEIMYKNNLIGIQLQRTLGWTDIDGDFITELVDPDPYGGYIELHSQIIGESTIATSFQEKGEVIIGDCKFAEVELNNIERDMGLVPLECLEFNEEAVNIYRGVKYRWVKIPKEYGIVLIPRLAD